MKHMISISTVEAMLICKALNADFKNSADKQIAERLHNQITEKVEYDLNDYRCKDCKHFECDYYKPNKGKCIVKSIGRWIDKRYAKTKACKGDFELKGE